MNEAILNQRYVFFMNANSLKNVFSFYEYNDVCYCKIFVTLISCYLFKIFIVLATWNRTLIWYILQFISV
jgi:hypothetical protein